MENIIFKALVGSHAYGTNIEGSDRDYKGVYMQSPEDVLNKGYQEQVTINKDETYYEVRRFIELCCTGNPTMLELLYCPEDCIEYIHPVFQQLVDHRDKFLSKSCKYSFGGYAFSQIGKARGLNKKMNWENKRIERKGVLDFCYIWSNNTVVPLREWLKEKEYRQELCGLTSLPHFRYMYNIFYDHVKDTSKDNPRQELQSDFTFKGVVQDEELSNDISLSEVPLWYKSMCEGLMYFNKDEYSTHCKEYREYQDWLKARNTQRYVDIQGHGQKIDGKNLLHCYRLLETGIEIAMDKTINVRRPNAGFLIEIRKGKHDLEKLLEEAEVKIQQLDEAFAKSELPDKVDRGFFLSLLPKLRVQYQESLK